MKKLSLKLSLIALLFFALSPLLSADIYVPTSTDVTFSYDSEVYNKDVEYTVECFGKPWLHDGMTEEERKIAETTTEKTFEYSASCPQWRS